MRFNERELTAALGDVARTEVGAGVTKWFHTRAEAVLHDPLTAHLAVHPNDATWVRARVVVSRRDDGRPCLIDELPGSGPHFVAGRTDAARFRARLSAACGARRA
jgi:hypothetical protein